MRNKSYLIMLLLYGFMQPLEAQKLQYELRFGVNLNFYNFTPLRFPGVKGFGSFMLSGQINKHIMTNYAATVSVYSKSIGNNLNPLVNDYQIDFVNSFAIGAGWGWQFLENNKNLHVGYDKYIRTINNSPAYNLKHHYNNALFVGTNFIINNHKRNQTVGSICFTTGDFSFNYANDGATPMNLLALGDNFDRFWTGSFLLMAHNNKAYNSVELSFDQFTGYSPLLYELSNILGMAVPEYENNENKSYATSAYNSAAYNLRIGLGKSYFVDFGVLGSLTYKGRHYSLQDIIHINRCDALHPNRDFNRFYYGITYNQFGYGN